MLITGKSNGQDITNVNNYSAVYYEIEMQVDVYSWHGLWRKQQMLSRRKLSWFLRICDESQKFSLLID